MDSLEAETLDPDAQVPSHFFSTKKADLASFLSCSQRAEFMTLLADRPNLLKKITNEQVVYMFTRFRYGAHEESMDFLFNWMLLHSDIEPELTAEFVDTNRKLFHDLTLNLVWQDRRGFDKLLDEYLELPDGSCCLPVAYTLSYCHLVQGPLGDSHSSLNKIKEWIELLSTKLDDNSLTGDRRVNWLLARAQAEEIRRGPAGRHIRGSERLLDGFPWLDEAMLVVETRAIELRVVKERTTRLAARQQWEVAEAGLEAYPELAVWGEEIGKMKERFAEQIVEQQANIEAEFLAELQRRQAKAIERGNQAVADRYAQSIDKLITEAASSKE